MGIRSQLKPSENLPNTETHTYTHIPVLDLKTMARFIPKQFLRNIRRVFMLGGIYCKAYLTSGCCFHSINKHYNALHTLLVIDLFDIAIRIQRFPQCISAHACFILEMLLYINARVDVQLFGL